MIVQANHRGVPKLYQSVLFESKFMTHEIGDCKVQDYIVQNPISIHIIISIIIYIYTLWIGQASQECRSPQQAWLPMTPRSKNTNA